MSTLKTVLITTAVLLVAAALIIGGEVINYQQTEIDSLNNQMSALQSQVSLVQNQTNAYKSKLSRTIKTTNKNFDTVEKQQTELRDALGILITALTGEDPDKEKAPTSFNRKDNQIKFSSITPEVGIIN